MSIQPKIAISSWAVPLDDTGDGADLRQRSAWRVLDRSVKRIAQGDGELARETAAYRAIQKWNVGVPKDTKITMSDLTSASKKKTTAASVGSSSTV
ncbi:hypothetical protein JJB98_21775 [Bradyrhizobium diazoefficiens]|nr:hypothetical protein [Bradyrhizobium diazoefficiens]QQO22377.1 hypothetical protein JJB98_21775 [Bradyrhizobium diazoefficiens]